MPMIAHFEQAGTGERRGSARRALRLSVQGHVLTHPARATIHDLSLTGVLIETSTPLASGESFEVELPEAGSVEATVVWNSGEFYGCQFREPISTAALSAALLRSPPQPRDVLGELRGITEQVERIASEVERAVKKLSDDR